MYNSSKHNQGPSGCGDRKQSHDCFDRHHHNCDKCERYSGRKTNSIQGFSLIRKRSQEHQEHGKRNYKDFKKSKLSNKEKEELCAANKCFNCKETGHTAHACPKWRNVAPTSGNKPPGLHNYNIEIATHDIGYLEKLDATTESNNSLGLRMMSFDKLDLSEERSTSDRYFKIYEGYCTCTID